MKDFYVKLDEELPKTSLEFKIYNLMAIQDFSDENCYWPRLAKLEFTSKLYDLYGYEFLYEIHALSCQIHFGLASCFLFRDKISIDRLKSSVFNHSYTFMIESTIHGIYAFWNRVGLGLNTYLKCPLTLKRTYFSNVVQQLSTDFPQLEKNKELVWIQGIRESLNNLKRNELAHINSLIMQDFSSHYALGYNDIDLLRYPELLLTYNNSIVHEIENLVVLMEDLEMQNN